MEIRALIGRLPTGDPGIDAGVIEDARARQRRHRAIGVLLAAVAAGSLIAGVSGGGGGGGAGHGAGGRPSGSGSRPGAAHVNLNRNLTAPTTQRGADGVASRACPLAPASRYLPARSGCVTVRRADVSGDGRPELILVYSRLGRRHPFGDVGSAPPSLRRDFTAQAAFLEIVFARGRRATAQVGATGSTWAAEVAAIAHVNRLAGNELFLETQRISSGATAVAYGWQSGRLVPAGVLLSYGGDSATRAGFDCLPGDPPRLIQRSFELIGPTIAGAWRETDTIYAWHGPKLVPSTRRTFIRHGEPGARTVDVGPGCAKGIG